MSGVWPDQCPVCACDLSARPAPSQCPDCGFEYDAQTRVWRSGESWVRLASVYTAAGLLLGILLSAIYRISSDAAPHPALPLVFGLAAPAIGLFVRRLVSGRITGRFVALTPGGVLVGTGPQPVLVPWEDIERAQEQRGVLKLQRRSTAALVALDDIFADPTEALEFRGELNATLRRLREPAGNGRSSGAGSD